MGTLLNKLDDSFFPAHRSYIINLKKLNELSLKMKPILLILIILISRQVYQN
ncbi:LytTR family transcriptional regulator DNA-binding domain-containing protein [Heyndrickxia ginsengihumi]|uniref:LytTR family transcriptional regulator DNA-binding domain-containing protein n=1 Tax=Heyndrickxia ginsengihumi TaxID=363870 RepID=UPI003461EE2F